MSLSNALNIGKTALANAQISINTASNNIANSETEGYQSVTTTYSSTSSISVSGNSLGTGADVSLETNWNSFVEKQYLSASADLASSTAVSDYLSQLDSIFNQSEDEGLAAAQDEFLSAWSDLSTYPDSLAEREALLGEAESLVYSLNSIASDLEDMSDAVSSEIVDQVATANELIDSIALLNEQIAASPDNTELISSRDQAIRELDEIIGVEVITSSDGTTKIYTESGQPLVEGTETHSLVYSSARSTESLQPTSTYDGDIEFSGTSSEEILIEFVSSGADGTAQFKVSLDGGETWEEDENGNTLLYTADDSDNAVTIAGVEISFSGGTTDHTVGDRYTVVAKTGLYWENSSGGLVNITPMTDDSGSDVNNRTTSGSLAGLFKVRDDYIEPLSDELDDYTEALIWEVNSAHSQGAGLEAHSAVEGTYSVDDQTAALSNCGLVYEDKITSGEFSIYTYDADGNLASNASISVDPATDSLDTIVSAINTAFSGSLTASVNSDGELEIQAATDTTFEFGEDTSGILAALGINTFFEGSTAEDISINSYVSSDTSHINAGVVDADDGTVSSGSNETAEAINDLLSETVSIGEGVSATDTSLTEYLAALVAEVGAAASTAETQVTCDTTTAELYYDLQESGSGVNVDEELINLTKYQQQYQAACQIIEVTREMIDSILDIV
ncbi:FlgK family flagellar hook-associated protein [Maridesulfovibrio sp.]|uniref:flagellar hook-associated protein FlgK n=1 Tax=Maridesulfovibrio sp. TaxID=2795000 RepID=UPI002A186C7A|nr:flagellar basal body rod C-terminal domain-containing protein [Maridesulfovibrio sp.]